MSSILRTCSFTFQYLNGSYHVYELEGFSVTVSKFRDSMAWHVGVPFAVVQYDLSITRDYDEFLSDIVSYYSMRGDVYIGFIEYGPAW